MFSATISFIITVLYINANILWDNLGYDPNLLKGRCELNETQKKILEEIRASLLTTHEILENYKIDHFLLHGR